MCNDIILLELLKLIELYEYRISELKDDISVGRYDMRKDFIALSEMEMDLKVLKQIKLRVLLLVIWMKCDKIVNNVCSIINKKCMCDNNKALCTIYACEGCPTLKDCLNANYPLCR